MHSARMICLLVSVLLSASVARAQVAPTGQFLGAAQENFETQTPYLMTACISERIFESQGDLCATAGTMFIAGQWVYLCSMTAMEGEYFAGAASGTAEIHFDVPVSRFGGYFAVFAGVPDASASFFGVDGSLLATHNMSIPSDCSWHWNSWERGYGPPIARAVIRGNAFDGRLVMMDALQADACPAPSAYCTSKLNSLGCSPMIGAVGWPSTSRGSGFDVIGRPILNRRFGFLFYGINGPAALPFVGGTLCVMPPLRLTPLQNSLGSPSGTDCSGTFSIDMHMFAAGALGGQPLLALQQPGTTVYCQWISRDPGFPTPNKVSLSNGLQSFICP